MKKAHKNAHGAGTIRKRPDGRWEGRCTIGFNEATGKQVQKSVYGKTQKEVREKMSKIIAEVDEGTYAEPTKLTVGMWLDEWLDTYVQHAVKPYTVDSYRSICKNHIKPRLGQTKLSKLTAPKVQSFYNELLTDSGLSAKTVKNVHGILHRALNQAMRVGFIKTNVAALCDPPKHQRQEVKPLEQDDVSALLKAIQGHDFELIYKVTLFTGLRQGEVLGLTWDAVDLDKRTIYVNKQLTKTTKTGGGKYILSPTKNSRGRNIYIAPYVCELLREQKNRQQRMKARAGDEWNNEWNLVFTNEFGKHLTHGTAYKHFKAIAKQIGLPDARFHDLRHSYAVISLESGDSIKTVQENLGHATSSFTLDVYGHVSQRMREQSADRMERYIQNVAKS